MSEIKINRPDEKYSSLVIGFRNRSLLHHSNYPRLDYGTYFKLDFQNPTSRLTKFSKPYSIVSDLQPLLCQHEQTRQGQLLNPLKCPLLPNPPHLIWYLILPVSIIFIYGHKSNFALADYN